MMSYSQIASEADRQARRAKRHGKQPHFMSGLGDDAIRRECRLIPFLGYYTPRGFKRVHVGETFGDNYGYGTADHSCLFVDHNGFGTSGELAMTFEQFAEFVQRHPGYGYGIVEAGQFQIVIAVYQRTDKRGVHTKLTGKLADDFQKELTKGAACPIPREDGDEGPIVDLPARSRKGAV